jgi:hypothetical protein
MRENAVTNGWVLAKMNVLAKVCECWHKCADAGRSEWMLA